MCVEIVHNCFQRQALLRTALNTSILQSINPLAMKQSYKLSIAQMHVLYYCCHAVQATPPTRTCGVYVAFKRVRSFFGGGGANRDKLALPSC